MGIGTFVLRLTEIMESLKFFQAECQVSDPDSEAKMSCDSGPLFFLLKMKILGSIETVSHLMF